MQRWKAFATVALLLPWLFAASCETPEPEVDLRILSASICPGGALRIETAVIDSAGLTLRIIRRATDGTESDLFAPLAVSGPGVTRQELIPGSRICPTEQVCAQVENDSGFRRRDCESVPLFAFVAGSPARHDLLFSPDCAAASYPPITVEEQDDAVLESEPSRFSQPGGSRIVLDVRNTDPDQPVTLTYQASSGEVTGPVPILPGESSSAFSGKALHGTWRLLSNLNASAPCAAEPGGSADMLRPIRIEVDTRCASGSGSCP